MSPLLLIPAAGAARRMRGADKLLETIGGTPLLRRQTMAAMTTGCPVVVTLPEGASDRRDVLRGLAIRIETVPEAAEGMSASLRHGAGLLDEGQSLGILLPDVPGVTCGDILAVLDAFRGTGETRPTRAGAKGLDVPGTPVFLPHATAKRLAELTGEQSGRELLTGQTAFVRFPDDRAIRDLDTPEDWAAWRAETNTPD